MARIVVLGSLPESLLNFRGALLKAMVEKGHEVHAVSPKANEAVIEGLRAIGVRHHEIRLARTRIDPVQDFGTLRALIKLLRRLDPDALLAYTIKPVIYGGLAARRAGVPAFFPMITGLGYAFSGKGWRSLMVGSVVRRLYRLALQGADKVFFQNPDNQAVFHKLGVLRSSEQGVLIPGSGVDLAYYATAPLPLEPAFLMIARLLRDKGVREYVEAARWIKARYPGVSFSLAGWIDENPAAIKQQELDKWIREGVVNYLGRLDDVRPAMAKASVYCLPSYHEGMPRTVLEAMAMGRPIITTDVPGCRMTVSEGKNGFLIPAGDARSLAEAMERFIKTPRIIPRMGAESRALAEKHFNVERVNRIILGAMGLCGEAAV